MIKEYKNIRELIQDSAVKFPDNIAFKVKIREEKNVRYDDVTYQRLEKEIKIMSKYLISKGLKGKRIAVIGKNSYRWMLVWLSVLSTDSVVVPLDKGLMEFEINDQLARSEADAIFYAEEYKDILKDKEDIIKICTDNEEFDLAMSEGETLDNDAEYDIIVPDNEKMSVLLFTSGTTSKSKAVMLSQKNLMADVYGLNKWISFRTDDVNMAILPFHHAFGMMQILLFLSNGICNVFCEGLRVDKCLNEYGVTIMVAVPKIIDEIYKTINRKLVKMNKLEKVHKGIRLTSFLRKLGVDVRRKVFKEIIDGLGGHLRIIIVGAAAANPQVLKFYNDIGIFSIQGYGLSETSPCITAENKKNMRTNSVGKALPNADVRIFEPDENGIGEIIVKGDMVMLGYYKDEENNSKVLKNGYFHTGDLGYIDKDGFVFISGRKKNVIVLENGKNVFPEEIESLLDECKFIKECIVYNNREKGKDCISAKIVYYAENGYEESKKEIDAFVEEVNEKLISYKKIKEIELTDVEMEKTTTMKIKR